MARSKTQGLAKDSTSSSMRRLSSFASIHSILSFSKTRRTANDTEAGATPHTDSSSATPKPTLCEISHNVQRTPLGLNNSNASTKIKDAAVLPRSKTFSSLPLPVKSKKQVRDADMPAIHTTMAPVQSDHPARRFRPSSNSKALPRSDTEPLLFSTSNKENDNTISRHFSSHVQNEPAARNLPRCPSFTGILPRASPRVKHKTYCRMPDLPQNSERQSAVSVSTSSTLSSTPARLPVFAFETPSRLESVSEVVLSPSKARAVTDAQPAAYWAARLSAALDRAKTSDLADFCQVDRDGLRADTDILAEKMHKLAYTRQAMVVLYAQCTTPEARESFVAFQMQYAALTNQPRLTRAICEDLSASSASAKTAQQLSDGPASSARKGSFVDKLLGRVKRSSIA